MATICSSLFIRLLGFIILMTYIMGNVHATDQVPDNQVWTPATATFFYGQPKANISCKFLGTPYGVYWMKGSTPATYTLLSRIQGKVSGPRFDDGSLTITDDYSLVFNNVQAGDEGNYICRVSNHNGFVIENNTDVRVLEPSVIRWAGYTVNLQCAFRGTPEQVLWNRVQGPSVETVLRYTSGGYEVLGDRRYSWSDNYGLIIRDLRVLDEGNFTCMVSKTGGSKMQTATVLTVQGLMSTMSDLW
ncbi:tyrosine-protein kinase-like otk [Strongylocentrotus purpuratus]|uniref:Ig-like domain-containing protein n=1 Tax=Strongylocentrotus purpuratus TaxID=7668 RepID=A0A7M7NBZ2_STRPU|nr:tyrosine-protein kinase-like otk [Strongylocentrotus purpuratus]